MNLRDISQKLEVELSKLFEESRSSIAAREDSRAFGAMIEDRIKQNWEDICSRWQFPSVARHGPRTIYDVAFTIEGWVVGLDVKTKDLDSKKYSDGGVCSVANLLKFIANDHGKFLVAEFGHKQSKSGQGRDLEYIRVAPLTLLPWRAFGAENLGTGQVRLKHTVSSVYDEIEWNRDDIAFLDFFTKKALEHYEKVGRVAAKRAQEIEAFRQRGYANFKFTR